MAGKPSTPGGTQGCVTERSLGGDVADVRPGALPYAPQPARDRQANTESAVAGNGDAGDEGFPKAACWCLPRLAGTNQMDLVTALPQAAHEVAHGVCDAVDLGRIGLGDHRHPQPRTGGFGTHGTSELGRLAQRTLRRKKTSRPLERGRCRRAACREVDLQRISDHGATTFGDAAPV
jgi:hypothetical protein